MKMTRELIGLAVVALAATGCTEKPQTIGSSRVADEVPYAGSKYPYAAPGWTAGDEKSWREQLRVRTQRGQNEYSRM